MTSKERIFKAAFTVFARKGRHGAKMEEIAAEAEINKAMIYYIFSSKDNLYEEVIRKIVIDQNTIMYENMSEDINSKKNPDEILKRWITRQFDLMWQNTDYTRIIIEAMSSNAKEVHSAVLESKELVHDRINNFVQEVVSAGKELGIFRKDLDSQQLFASIFSLNLMFFMTRTFYEMLGLKVGDESTIIENHKKHIIDLIFNGVLAR